MSTAKKEEFKPEWVSRVKIILVELPSTLAAAICPDTPHQIPCSVQSTVRTALSSQLDSNFQSLG